jgi:hypothetical protein
LRHIHFNTPTPEELAKVEEEKTAKIVEAAVNKAVETVTKSFQPKLDSMAAELRKAKEEPGKGKDGEKKDDSSVRMSAADKDINERLQKVEARDGKVTTKAIRSGVRQILTEMGHSGDGLQDALDLFMLREGTKLSYDDDNETVLVTETEGADPVSLQDMAKSGKLKKYQRAKVLPKTGPSSAPGAGFGGDGTQEMTPAEFAQAQKDGVKIDLTKVKMKF